MKTIHKMKGDVIITEKDDTSDAYIIIEGEVDVSKNGTHLATLYENSMFGEIAMIDDRPRTATCTAKTNCTLGTVTRENYKQLLRYRPEAINPLLRIVATRLRSLTDFMEELHGELK